MSDSPFFKDCPPPAPAYFEKNVGLLYENARAFFYALLYAIRILSDFFLTYLSGGALGEAQTFLNVRIGNRESAVKASVSQLFEANVAEALKGFGPQNGFRRLLSNAAGEFAGNLAAMASTDEELSRSIGESLAQATTSAFERLGEANGGDVGEKRPAQCHANVVFVRGPLCVLRVRVCVSSEGVASLLALTAGPTAADWWRFGVQGSLNSFGVLPGCLARLIDSAARTCVATLLCRQVTSVSDTLTESLRGEVGLHLDAQPVSASREADYLFEQLRRVEKADSCCKTEKGCNGACQAAGTA